MRDRRRPRLMFVAAVIAAALTTAAGCGEKSEETTGNAVEDFDLALDFFVNADHAGIYTAMDRGYFADAGLNLRPRVPADPSAPIKQVAAGRVDLAISYEPEVMLAREGGLDVVAVAAIIQEPLTSLISLPAARIKQPADLAGKTRRHRWDPVSDGLPGHDPAQQRRRSQGGRPGRRRPQPAAAGAQRPGRRDVRRLPQRRGRAAAAHRHEPEGRTGQPARHPELRRARAGRSRRAGAGGSRADQAVHRRPRARHDRRPQGPAARHRRAARGLPGARSEADAGRGRATLPFFFPPADRPYGWMDPSEWVAFAGYLADEGQLDQRLGTDELLTDELLPGEIPE